VPRVARRALPNLRYGRLGSFRRRGHIARVALSVLIAPDKFKGTLTAPQAARAIARGWKAARPKDRLTLLPISDGGDGFGPLLAKLMRAKGRVTTSCDAAHNDIRANWWFRGESRTAIIESAKVVGLAMLRRPERNPMRLDSMGMGWLMNRCSRPGKSRQKTARHAIIGIGGSATNDGGFGMAVGLGWRFLDATGKEIARWPHLSCLKKIVPPEPENPMACLLEKVTVAVDVQNSLLGRNGCARVYGPQKGLRTRDMPKAEAALTRLAEVWESQTGEDAAGLAGAGAAGGLGFGLHCFAGAEIRPGFEIFAEAAGLAGLIKKADLIITGEGAMDRQTVMGKGVGELAKLARDHDCSCIGLAGQLEDALGLKELFLYCDALTRLTTMADAEAKPGHWLARLARNTAERLEANGSPTTVI
jgi:glycerate kinase